MDENFHELLKVEFSQLIFYKLWEMTMTRPMIMMPQYSMKIYEVKTFVNCPQTVKFARFSRTKGSC